MCQQAVNGLQASHTRRPIGNVRGTKFVHFRPVRKGQGPSFERLPHIRGHVRDKLKKTAKETLP